MLTNFNIVFLVQVVLFKLKSSHIINLTLSGSAKLYSKLYYIQKSVHKYSNWNKYKNDEAAWQL